MFRIQHLDSRFATDQLTSAHGHVKISLRLLAKLVGLWIVWRATTLTPYMFRVHCNHVYKYSIHKHFANARMHLSQRIEEMVLLLGKLVAPTACFPINGEMICT